MKKDNKVICFLKWDSKFWGFPIAYITTRYLNKTIILKVKKFIKSHRVRMIQYLCDCHDRRSVDLAEKNNFEFKDIRITFEKNLLKKKYIIFPRKNKELLSISYAKKNDLKKLKLMTNKNYLESRYYFDDNFNKKKISIFYSDWVAKAINGKFDNECLVLLKKKNIVGFCTLRYSNGNKIANIGLFGISNKEKGKGYGLFFLNKIFKKLYKAKLSKIRVVTQGRNYSAQRLYQKAGFLTLSTELWYHKWIF